MNPLMEKSIYAEKTRSHEYRLTPGQSLEMPLPWQAYLKEGSPQDIDEFTDKVHHWQRRHINELANKLEDDETPDQIR